MEKVIFEEVAAGQPLPLLSFYLSRNDVISFHQTVGIGRDDFVSPIMILAIAMSKMSAQNVVDMFAGNLAGDCVFNHDEIS